MGSLTSSPNIPQQPTVVVKEVSQSTDSADTVLSGAESEELSSDERKKSLLARDRSRVGTIFTSFLGLSDDDKEQRKTLLGE